MKVSWRRIWTSVAQFSAIFLLIGAYQGVFADSLALRQPANIWRIAAISAFLVLLWLAFPHLLEAAIRIREYEKIKTAMATLQLKYDQLENDLQSAEKEAATNKPHWINEGQRQIIGALLTKNVVDGPALSGIDLDPTGSVFFIANWDDPEYVIGARFRVEVISSGAERGIVEISDIDARRKKMTLRRVDDTPHPLWAHLTTKAAVDTNAPGDLVLVPERRPLRLISTLQKRYQEALAPLDPTEEDL